MSRPPSEHPPLVQQNLQALLRAAFQSRAAKPGADAPQGDSELSSRESLERGRSEYRILGEIARGGMGIVLKVRDDELHRDLAVKVLRESLARDEAKLARFVEEAQIGGQLQHPGIVPVYEVGRMADRRPYFAMKLIRGRTLAELLAERKSPSEDAHSFLGIFHQICQAMAYAHSRGVVHRDLKPGNVMIGSFGEVQVVDWGLAKTLGARAEAGRASPAPVEESAVTTRRNDERSSTPDSIAGSVMGTPAYMPPEQARGELGRVDERADVFSLGAILFEILTGRPPYRSEESSEPPDSPEAALDRARARLSAMTEMPELADLARRCLSPDPDARPRTAADLSKAVESYRSSVEERARTAQISAAEARVRAAEERRARRLTIALAGSVLLLAGGGVGARLWLHRHDEVRRARTSQLVGAALDRATLAFGQASSSTDPSRWEAASTEIGRAQSILEAGEASQDLEQRTRDLAAQIRSGADSARERADLGRSNRELLARLSFLRAPEVEGTGNIDWARVDSDYAAAFREEHLQLENRPAADAAREARDRGIGVEVAVGLDEWAVARTHCGRAAEAALLVQVAVLSDPDDTRSRMRLALLRGDADSLLRCSKEAELESLPIATLSLLGSSLEKAGAEDEAIRVLRVAQRVRPDDYVTELLLGRLLWDRDYHDAARCYTAALAARPDDVVAAREYGWLLDHYLLDPAQAIALYRRSLESRPEDVRLHLYLGHALLSSGDVDHAQAEYSESLRLDPKRLSVGLLLAECALRKGALDEAIRWSREFIAAVPESASAHSDLGRALMQRGDLREAIVELRKANETRSDIADNGDGLREALERAGDDDGALEIERRTLAERPESLLVDYDLGLDLAEIVDVDSAIPPQREAVHLHPTSPAQHAMLGVLLEAKGSYSEALFELRVADDLGSKLDNWSLPSENRFTESRRLILVERRSERWVRDARRRAEIEGRLERVVRGEESPHDPDEQAEFARLALRRGRFLEAATLFERRLAVDRVLDGLRVEAASAAVLATPSSSADCVRWRSSAASWLSSDLDDLTSKATSADPEVRAQVNRILGRWRHDRRLESVRGAEAIVALPTEEQATWNALWSRLEDLRGAARRAAGALDK